jgi:hypothetical protein
MSPQRTAWHFYFTILLRNRRPLWIDVRDEVPLSEERARVDYLFLRKTKNPAPGDTGQTLHRLWPLIPEAAIAEFKSVTRPYRARGLDRLFLYLHAYWLDAAELKQRHDLVGVLIVANRTPTLDADVKLMGLKFQDLQDGYWEIAWCIERPKLPMVGVNKVPLPRSCFPKVSAPWSHLMECGKSHPRKNSSRT